MYTSQPNLKLIVKILIYVSFFGLISCQSENEKYADNIINKVEDFKKQNGRLPNEVSEIGLEEWENSLAFYQKKSDSTYVVWIGLGLGESKIYNSETGKWTKGG